LKNENQFKIYEAENNDFNLERTKIIFCLLIHLEVSRIKAIISWGISGISPEK
jgi:hypothetical protein